MNFEGFPKISRLSREMIITEKIDGTNAQVYITDDGSDMLVGSRTRWLGPAKADDNYGFYTWAMANKDELVKLGPGRHFGEWWGNGIQRGYGLPKGVKKFSLFNVSRWNIDTPPPSVCNVVPVLYKGPFDTAVINSQLTLLGATGSKAVPGFMNPEGIVIYHAQSGQLFKKTLENDDAGKGFNA